MPDHVSPTDARSPSPEGPGAAPRIAGYSRGDAIGPYTIRDVIGEGGFGTVYLAEQREPVRRRVALKVVKPGMDSAEVIARFEAERQALSVMDHPNVARVLDAGVTPDGRPFFAMEHVRGVPITEYCDQNRLAMKERIELFIAVCRAVQHAHQKGIIHRDLKPSNILVTTIDAAAVPKVIDFGIAKAMGQSLSDDTVYTQVGRMIGTLEYMSPEQAGGNQDIDTRTDIYSLGVVLYQLLSGSLPFESATLRRAGYDAIQKIIREVDPPKPSTRLGHTTQSPADAPKAPQPSVDEVARHRRTDAASLRRQLRGDLDWITMKALEKDRARRYDSPSALALDLERHLRSEPVSAGPPSAGYRIGKFLRRHRAAAIGVAACLTLLVAGLITSLSLYRQADTQRRNAEFQAARADDQARVAQQEATRADEQMRLAKQEAGRADQEMRLAQRQTAKVQAAYRFVSDMFGAIDPDTAKGRDVTVREVLDSAAARVGDTLKTEPEVQATVLHAIGTAYHQISRYASAETSLRRALEIQERTPGPMAAETLQTVHNLGAAVLAQDRVDEAMPLLRRAAEGRAQLLGPRHQDTLASRSLLAFSVQVSGDLPGAEKLIRAVIDDQTAELGKSHRDTIDSRSSLADVLQDLGRFDEALQVSGPLVADAVAALGDDDTLTLQARSIHASILGSLERDAEAEPVIRAVIASKQKILGPDAPGTLTSENVLADTLKNLDRFDEAEALQRSIVARARRVLGAEHTNTLTYTNNLAQTLRNRGKFAEAEPLYRMVLDARRTQEGETSRETLILKINMGRFYTDQKKFDQALPYYQTALQGFEATIPEHWMTAASRGYLAECLADLKRFDEAEPVMLKAYAEIVKALPPTHGRSRAVAKATAKMYSEWGKPDQAKEWEAKAAAPPPAPGTAIPTGPAPAK